MASQMKSERVGLYIHWPFCEAKCPYCDFNSHVSDSIDHDQWLQAYLNELDYIVSQTNQRNLVSIFFGGGTPSLMRPHVVKALINKAYEIWSPRQDIEITLEANPTSIEAQKFKDFKSAGVNRVSIGVQSFDDEQLNFLGRKHSSVEAIEALTLANKIFGSVSFDLMYALPDQSVPQWEAQLKNALPYINDHLSLYQLTIEPKTPFFTQHQRGDFQIPPQDQAADFYSVTQEIMNDFGMPAYEVSNHAKDGRQSAHNGVYWAYDDYIGIGPGAHGRVSKDGQKFATRTRRAPEIWLQKSLNEGHGYHNFEAITHEDQFIEMVMMGLRVKKGIHLQTISQKTGIQFLDYISENKIISMVEEGFITYDQKKIIPTAKGSACLNSLISYLLLQ
ncbi:MAG: radical SAM family heme chaperone HemW [Pseudomonadota bacterium]